MAGFGIAAISSVTGFLLKTIFLILFEKSFFSDGIFF